MNTKTPHTIVIGGGVAGLTAATLLAHAGQRVTLFEKSRHWGGRALTNERNGYYFNVGPHALYRKLAAERISAEIGIQFNGKVPAINRHAVAIYQDRHFQLPSSPTTLATSDLLSLREKASYVKFTAALMRAKTEQLKGISFRQWVEQTTTDPKIRETAYTLSRVATYTNAPDQMEAGATVAQMRSALTSNVLYLDHGWQQWVDQLVAAAEAAGVVLHKGVRVKEVAVSADGHTIHYGDSNTLIADNLVLAVPPSMACKLLPQSKQLSESVAKLLPVKVATLTIGLREVPHPERTLALGVDEPLYYSLHSASADLAPANGGVAHLISYLPPNDATDPAIRRARMEKMLDRLQPSWREHLAEQEFLPKITVTHGANIVGHSRPQSQIADLPCVFVTGDWVGDEGWLADASIASAKQVADAILTHHASR